MSRLTLFTDAAIFVDRGRDLLRRRGHLLRDAGDALDRRGGLLHRRGASRRSDAVRLAVLAVTCSIDAAISLTDDASSSAEAETDSACVAVSFSEAAISFIPDSAPSTAASWVSAPSAT